LETFIETENYSCAPRFPLIASCYKFVDSQTSFTLCESESEILERSASVSKHLKGRRWSRTFYLRPRIPDRRPW